MRKRLRDLVAGPWLCLLVGTVGLPADDCQPSCQPTPPPPPAPDAPPGQHEVKTVFLIVLENMNWSLVKGSSSAPYINGTLLPMSSYATQLYNPPGNHPSEPNYLWLESGQSWGVTNDADPSSNHQSSSAHLARLLEDAGVTWKSYQEDIDGTTCPLVSQGKYAPKHNPFVFFDDMTGTNNPNDAHCIAHVRPYGELQGDLDGGTVARYNFITPNLCDDGHDLCGPTLNQVKQADTWLSENVPAILASQAYRNGGVLLITWDEAALGDGPIGMIVLSPLAKGGGYSNSIHYTHSSTLRTLEEVFDVGPYLADAANATSLADLFQTYP